jgi:hypothetical protein
MGMMKQAQLGSSNSLGGNAGRRNVIRFGDLEIGKRHAPSGFIISSSPPLDRYLDIGEFRSRQGEQ